MEIQQFRNASRSYSDASTFLHQAIARKAGLTGADHKYLGLLLQHEELTAGELSKLTGLTTGAVTGLIDRLEKKQLVQRQFSKDDRRKVIIVPNVQHSMDLLEPLFVELQQRTSALIGTFSDVELMAIERYFTQAATIMKEVAANLNQKP